MLLRRARDKKENNNTSPKYLQCISTSPNMADYITYYLNFLSCVLAILLLAEKKMSINFVFLLQKENTISYR